MSHTGLIAYTTTTLYRSLFLITNYFDQTYIGHFLVHFYMFIYFLISGAVFDMSKSVFGVDLDTLLDELPDRIYNLHPNPQPPRARSRFIAEHRVIIDCGRNISSCYTTATNYLMIMFKIEKHGLLIVTSYPHYPHNDSDNRAYSCSCAWSTRPGYGHRAPGLNPHQ